MQNKGILCRHHLQAPESDPDRSQIMLMCHSFTQSWAVKTCGAFILMSVESRNCLGFKHFIYESVLKDSSIHFVIYGFEFVTYTRLMIGIVRYLRALDCYTSCSEQQMQHAWTREGKPTSCNRTAILRLASFMPVALRLSHALSFHLAAQTPQVAFQAFWKTAALSQSPLLMMPAASAARFTCISASEVLGFPA